jgi:hypothetical protein
MYQVLYLLVIKCPCMNPNMVCCPSGMSLLHIEDKMGGTMVAESLFCPLEHFFNAELLR